MEAGAKLTRIRVSKEKTPLHSGAFITIVIISFSMVAVFRGFDLLGVTSLLFGIGIVVWLITVEIFVYVDDNYLYLERPIGIHKKIILKDIKRIYPSKVESSKYIIQYSLNANETTSFSFSPRITNYFSHHEYFLRFLDKYKGSESSH